MRGLASILAVLLIALPAQAQQALAQRQPAATPKPVKPKPAQQAKQAKPAKSKPKPATAKPLSPKDAYAAMSLHDRVAIQSDLVWTGDYNGVADGGFNDRSVNAVKAFQARQKTTPTGILGPQERTALARQAKAKRDAVGWTLVEDAATGTRVGVPAKLAPQSGAGRNGSRWFSGQLQIESFRLADTALPVLFEQHKTESERKVEYSTIKPDFFVISGTQGPRKFYVRAHAVGGEARGISVLYDHAMQGAMDPVVVAMSGAFIASSPVAEAVAAARRKVEYGTGIVVSSTGHIVTDRLLTDDCQVITVPGQGNADRIAQDETSGLALLRLYGARDLKPLPLADAAQAGAVTLVGVADPQAQGGGGAVSMMAARLAAPRAVEPAPAQGFVGAAVTDGRGGLIGVLKPRSGNGSAALTPVNNVRAFLQAQNVDLGSEATGGETATASVVRVICVRK